ncbi:MAG: diguanylate cyclase [Lachnospiraceae bacterium]|nr:diguanylate cyclase [Lachnospiraceae bacterium]
MIDFSESIQKVLSHVGRYSKTHRVYVFNPFSERFGTDIYEWCAEGIVSGKNVFALLLESTYLKEHIQTQGEFIIPDTNSLPKQEQDLFTPLKTKSLAILPLITEEEALGYVGFAYCDETQNWDEKNLPLLRDMADIIRILLERYAVEKDLQQNLTMLHIITANPSLLICTYDIHTKEVLYINATLAQTLNIRQEDIAQKRIRCCTILKSYIHNNCAVCPSKELLDEQGNTIATCHAWESENKESGKWYLIRSSITQWVDGREAMVEVAIDITRQKVYELQLQFIASRDALTNTFNRDWGHRLLDGYMQHSDTLHCIVFIDLDRLKYVNDHHGHSAGDFFILKIVEIIQNNIRKSDTLCRWGGDEFLLITYGGIDSARLVVDRILEKLEHYNTFGACPFHLDFSYGIEAIQQMETRTVDEIVGIADHAMYQHKLKKKKAREKE